MRILEEIGILFLNDDALRILKEAGCDVDMGSKRVRMDRAFVMEQVKKAPRTFDDHAAQSGPHGQVGGNNMLFVNVSSPPNAMDLDRGRRPGTRDAFAISSGSLSISTASTWRAAIRSSRSTSTRRSAISTPSTTS